VDRLLPQNASSPIAISVSGAVPDNQGRACHDSAAGESGNKHSSQAAQEDINGCLVTNQLEHNAKRMRFSRAFRKYFDNFL
jgi:hypothetical protein